MSRVLSSILFQDGKKRLLRFTCGHFLVMPYDKLDWVHNRKCSACEVGRTIEQNKENILMRYPELEPNLNEPIF